MITITVPGRPIPKGRPRLGKGGRTYTPRTTLAHERTIGWLYRSHGHPKLAGDLHLAIHFIMPNRRRVDIDNLAKTVLDGLNGIAYEDDAQVTRLTAVKSVGEPCTVITLGATNPVNHDQGGATL
ncbi:RusA family crossover junction endodeoxyribonuclease [Nesterenkonia sp. K-15-9-6]|uniref:RusA family crossover junction endodeoxyribonuclease n=1 Tax=Nesterenkonia sp. K-15-9-6 TaxID=3093918 RepID=UPI004044C451